MIRALIFDFDGLILDTEVPAFQSWQEIYQEHGCSLLLSSWATIIGGDGGSTEAFDPYADLEARLGRSIDREEVRRKVFQRHAELMEAQPILPGVEERIAEAKRLGLKLGLVSSSSRNWVTGHLSRLGLAEDFDCIRCSDDVQRTKPDPELYHSVLDALGLRSDEAIALEDSPNGILAAKRAGIFCVVVPNPLTSQLPLHEADLQLGSLGDLPLQGLLLEAQKDGR